ncbi:hypothetical protein FRB91_003877 [Serendipita sp. 411]|nr:hypothetical protein FRB91_003877 [Serendipita sp. 411]
MFGSTTQNDSIHSWLFTLAFLLFSHPSITYSYRSHIRLSRQSIDSCLTNLNVTYPGDSFFHSLSQTFNSRLSYTPAAIILPSSVRDVERLVTCGARLKLPVVSRSGGHSYAGYGLGGVDGALVADLSSLKQIVLSGDNVVVQTGNTLGEVATYLWDHGRRALPHGTCPKVGTGGHTSYGGYGPYSRMAGLLMDRVVSADVVLANGTSVTASQMSHPDLFWALKGAAPSYGIVTSWTYSTLTAPTITVSFFISLPRYTSGDTFATAFSKYQAFVHTAPRELAMAFAFGGDSKGIGAQLTGNYFGSKSKFINLVSGLVQDLNGSISHADEYSDWTKLLVANGGEQLVTTGPSPPNTFFAKSLVTFDLLDDTSLKRWGDYLVNTAIHADIGWFAQADLYGGAISSDFDASSSSFAHRDAFLVFQFYGSSKDNAPYPSDGMDVINKMLTSLSPNPTAAYPNYIDPTLTDSEWQSQYFGTNMARLREIKASYDPNNVFTFPQSIPVGNMADTRTPAQSMGTRTNSISGTGRDDVPLNPHLGKSSDICLPEATVTSLTAFPFCLDSFHPFKFDIVPM